MQNSCGFIIFHFNRNFKRRKLHILYQYITYKISYIKTSHLNKYMNLIYKQATTVSPLKKANELDNKNINLNPIFKHFIKCKSCLWKITFYESTGASIPINSNKIRCPVCKEKEMDSKKIKIIS
jgi:hypothetical protein